MTQLPEKFRERMKRELGCEFPVFLRSYERPAYRAVRINSLKLSAEEFEKISPFPLGERTPWEENGFYVSEEKVGRYSHHFAGLYYSQEPSAMSVAPLLGAEAGDRVLDLCSAPGGKGTRLAEATGGKGLVVMNEYVSSRAKILSQNVERMGIANAVVLNESPESLSEKFVGYFDKILVDAPCSGEGMFKKNEEEALSNWSEENVLMCARRQRSILNEAAKMLRAGGKLAYSTCTFSREEDEDQTAAFLREHPEFTLLEERKLYPHEAKGEGHYAALFSKREGEEGTVKPAKATCDKNSEKLYRAFEREFTDRSFQNLHRAGDVLYALPDGMFSLKGLNVLRAGVRLGDFTGERFEPSHSLAMVLKRKECKNFLSLTEEEALKYLRGETLVSENQKGWCVVGIGDYPLGLGKISGGVVKNHYPKGLRATLR